MASSLHRIRRQQWLFSTATNEYAFTLRKQFREQWEDALLPIFEMAFDEFSDEDEIIHIPKLEIKLKVGCKSELWEELPKALYAELAMQLKSFAVKKSEPQANAVSGSKNPASIHNYSVLIHYLRNGNLPWQATSWSAGESIKNLKDAIHQNWLQLIDYVHESDFSETLFFRLLQLLSVEQSVELVNNICSNLPSLRVEGLKILFKELLSSGNTYFDLHTRLSLAARFLSFILTNEDQQSIPDLMENVGSVLLIEKNVDFQRFIASSSTLKALYQSNTEPQLFDSLTTQYKEVKSPGISVIEGKDPLSPAPEYEDWKGEKSLELTAVEGKSEFPGEYSEPIESMALMNSVPLTKLQSTSRLKVQCAGLVILHPFLHRFMIQTGILADQEKDISFFNLPRAAALLYFLATGSDELYEFELSFIKLLLGMNPEQSLPVSVGLLSQSDKEEAVALLQSAISYWTVLKNTSVDGLRTSFLQRSALVHQSDEGWMVQMETAPFDMLINQLSWSFTIIKLPWMKKPIYTEWQTL